MELADNTDLTNVGIDKSPHIVNYVTIKSDVPFWPVNGQNYYGNQDNATYATPIEVTAEDIFNVLAAKYEKYGRESSSTARLVYAIASFGDNGCTAQMAHAKAFDTPYEHDGHPFANVGLFVEPVPNKNKCHANNKVNCAFVDTRFLAQQFPNTKFVTTSNYTGQIKPYFMVERISRSHKNWYRLSNVGKKLFKTMNENEKFYSIEAPIKQMLKDPYGISHYMMMKSIEAIDVPSIGELNAQINEALSDSVISGRFRAKLKSYQKKLFELAA